MTHPKMHDDELDIDDSLVKALLNQQFPQWATLPVKRVSSDGTDNAIFRLGTDMCLRLPRTHAVEAQIEKEQTWLPRLAPLLPLAIPVPLGKGQPSRDYALHWSIYRWLEGKNMAVETAVDLPSVAIDLAEFLNALHQIDTKGAPLSRRGEPLITQHSEVEEALESLEGLIDTQRAASLWQSCLKAPSWDKSPVWLHGDLLPANLLIHQGKLSAVIDFGILGIGDPACDLIAAWSIFTQASRAIFRERLQIDEATWTRGRGWALSIALIILPYYLHTNPGLVKVAYRILSEIFND